jgi:hypothetical protein
VFFSFTDELSVSKNFGNHNDIPVMQEELFPSVKIDVLSSKERVVVKTDGKIVSWLELMNNEYTCTFIIM